MRCEAIPETPAPAVTRRDSATAVLLVVVVGLLMQAGSAVAVMVIDSVGVVEALWLRTALAALMLAAARPRLVRLPAKGERLLVLALVLSLVVMNFCFYEAISRAPVGIVVAVEFLGPLGVAVAGSRRWLDVVWVVLAGVGVGLLARPNGSVGLVGLLFALCAAVCWAAFIVIAKRTVSRMDPLRATLSDASGGFGRHHPDLVGDGGQDRRLRPAPCFWVWRSPCSRPRCPISSSWSPSSACGRRPTACSSSIEPAIAALMGFLILSQRLAYREIGAIVAIVAAAAGASWAAGGSSGGG